MIKRNLPKKKGLHFPKAIKGSQDMDGHEQKDTPEKSKKQNTTKFFSFKKKLMGKAMALPSSPHRKGANFSTPCYFAFSFSKVLGRSIGSFHGDIYAEKN